MKKKYAILILVAVVVLIYVFANSFINKNLEAVDKTDTDGITVEIPSGSSTDNIAQILHENNLIKNTFAFKYYAEKTNRDILLKAGSFVLSRSMNADELLQALTNGGISDNTANVTIIEGLTVEDAAKSISEQLDLDYDKLLDLMNNASVFRDDFEFLSENPDINNLQGYLMPDTYNVYINSSEEDIVRVLLSQFDKFYVKEIKPRMEGLRKL